MSSRHPAIAKVKNHAGGRKTSAAKQPTVHETRQRVAVFNDRCPVGSQVSFRGQTKFVKSAAHECDGVATLQLVGMLEPVRLDEVSPVQ